MNEIQNQNFPKIILDDSTLVLKTGLGCSCDITQEISGNNCCTQFLDIDLLNAESGIEYEKNEQSIKALFTGANYEQMNTKLNSFLGGNAGINLGKKLSFSRSLNNLTENTGKNIDMYEYGIYFIIRKLFSVNLKPYLTNNLRKFVKEEVWNDINEHCTYPDEIKKIFKKYGTHITTKAFYGCMYQYILYREQNYWESSMNVQTSIGVSAKVPIPETGMNVSGETFCTGGKADSECFAQCEKTEIEKRTGGDTGLSDVEAWLKSCSLEKENYAFLGYVFNMDNTDNGLIPIYELFDETEKEKREKMKEVLDEYINENYISLENSQMVIVDIYTKYFPGGEKDAKEIIYGIEEGSHDRKKYFRINPEITQHVHKKNEITDSVVYFYYCLGHLVDEAVVDAKFVPVEQISEEWEQRGPHSDEPIKGGLLDNRALAIKKDNIKYAKKEDFVTGFSIQVDKREQKFYSKGTDSQFDWKKNKDSVEYYYGCRNESVECFTTKKELKEFF